MQRHKELWLPTANPTLFQYWMCIQSYILLIVCKCNGWYWEIAIICIHLLWLLVFPVLNLSLQPITRWSLTDSDWSDSEGTTLSVHLVMLTLLGGQKLQALNLFRCLKTTAFLDNDNDIIPGATETATETACNSPNWGGCASPRPWTSQCLMNIVYTRSAI